MNKYLLYISVVLTLAACSDMTDEVWNNDEEHHVTITSDIEPFEGETITRVNIAGDGFINEVVETNSNGTITRIVTSGDYIRLKIICPFVSGTERGEHTDGNSYDSFYYLTRHEGQWRKILSVDGFDISGTYSPSNSPDIASYYEAQQTPYVYVATTWSEERRFVANGSLYDHLTPVFHADQSKEKHYRASDVLWAQTFMQTGAWNIHLGFQHKMACLDVTVNDDNLDEKISDAAVLTLENMPDIDQAEIVVGDYYADASKSNSGYGYRQKSSCSYENNGKVLGIAVNDESAKRARIMQMTGNPSLVGGDNSSVITEKIKNDATYTAYKQALKHYRLVVPPCNLDPNGEGGKNATFWLRDGSRRFKVKLERLSFEEGKLYPVTLKLGATPDPDPYPEP